jgi:SAM-dependent methyltransferase
MSVVPKCRICQSDESNQHVRAPHVFGGEGTHQFWECDDCSAIYLNPIPSMEDEKRFYVQEFEKFMSTRVGDHRDWSNAEIHKKTNQDQVKRRMPFLQEHVQKGMDLLEIGCSSGFMLDAFRDTGVNCVGVEPSGEFNEFLEQSGHSVVCDLCEITNQKFDVITHFFVFEHIRDPYKFLKDSYELLKDGGVMICEIPCANDPLTSMYDIEAFEKFYWSIAHHYYYSPQSLSYVLDQLGYRYELVPEQRYDLSNHMTWMLDGKPGGQGRFTGHFGEDVLTAYRKQLIDTWQCDTIFFYVWKDPS